MPLVETPYLPQWGPGANYRRADCGVADLAMLLALYGKLGKLTIDQLAAETTLRYADVGLMPADLVKLAARHDLATYVRLDTTEDDLRAEILAGRPAIVLLAYRYVLNRLDQADSKPGNDGHYVLVVGFDGDHFVLNDSDYWQPYAERGHDVLVPVSELRQAMSVYSFQSVMIGEAMSLAEELSNVGKKLEAMAALVAQLESQSQEQPPVTPKPVEDPLPGDEEEKVLTSGVNVRLDSGATSQRLDGLAAGTRVTIQGSVTAQEPGSTTSHVWASLKKVNGVVRTYQVGDRTVYGRIARDVAFS